VDNSNQESSSMTGRNDLELDDGVDEFVNVPGVPSFDVTAAGVPAVTSFALLSNGDQVVTVQFKLGGSAGEEETPRKMLVAKYGRPIKKFASGLYGDARFDDEHGGDGKFIWSLPRGMKLIWNAGSFGPNTLSYTDEPKFNAMMARAQHAADQGAVTKAAAADKNF
jgi:hypothetical protein